MTERVKRVKSAKAPTALTPPEPDADAPARRRLEGFASYVVYLPVLMVFTLAAYLFVDAVERYLYGDDQAVR